VPFSKRGPTSTFAVLWPLTVGAIATFVSWARGAIQFFLGLRKGRVERVKNWSFWRKGQRLLGLSAHPIREFRDIYGRTACCVLKKINQPIPHLIRLILYSDRFHCYFYFWANKLTSSKNPQIRPLTESLIFDLELHILNITKGLCMQEGKI